ncbi:unnamed protein product [Dibothriocephalus latus]|uniref:Uncharacterized protein n=1 Tax=Dibothriocephalus latus TaxID=60516 RepID=A0A3P7LZA6_DIBLA|nr:unnamed protein product [Dibothriocephalus latus]
MIQRYFHDLTMSFLFPIPVPESGRFNMDEFFRTLETLGPQLTCEIKGDWAGLYSLADIPGGGYPLLC